MSIKRSALKKPLVVSAKMILEWRPGSSDEFPPGLKEELDDIEKFDARWKTFMRTFAPYDSKNCHMVDVDEIIASMKKTGFSAHDTIMFLKRLRRLNLVRFTFDNEALIGKLDRITWLLN